VFFTPSSETPDDIWHSSVCIENIDNLLYSYHLVRLRFIKQIDNKFKWYIFNFADTRKLFERNCNGITRYTLSVGVFQDASIYYPESLEEQQRIADILTTVDNAIDSVQSLIDKHELIKQGMMDDLFTRWVDPETGSLRPHPSIAPQLYQDSELGLIPKEWEVKRLQELLSEKIIISHLDWNHWWLYPKSHEFVEFWVPYVSANAILSGDVDYKNVKFLPKDRASKFVKWVAEDGDVLFAHNATVWPAAILETKLSYMILSTTLTYYRCNKEKLQNNYLLNYMRSSLFQDQCSAIMWQTTRNQIPITTQRTLNFVMPNYIEQWIITEKIEWSNNLIKSFKYQKQKLLLQKQWLMQDLLSGKVRVI